MRLGIDLDNVVWDFQQGWADLYEQWFGVKAIGLTEWNAFLDGTHFGSAADFWEWSDLADLWRKMPLVPGAQGALWNLSRAGHTLDFVTSRHPSTFTVTVECLLRDLPFTKDNARANVHFRESSTKHEVDCDLYLDDSPTVIRSLQEHGKNVVRFRWPWNKGVDAFHSVDSWADFEAFVEFVTEALA